MGITYKYTIYTEPKAKKRPKVYRWSTVNPSKKDEQLVARIFNSLNDLPKQPLNGQIRVQVKFYKSPPKSTPKWQFKLMEEGFLRPAKSPDLDNYVKLILDSLNGILWEDDRFIVEMHSGKFYSLDEPRIELIVDEIPTPTRKTKEQFLNNSEKYESVESFFD